MTYLQEKGEDIEMDAVGVPEGQKRIDYYSLPAHVVSHRVSSARYAAYPARDAESYELLPSLIPVVCYTCAALVYEILCRPEQAAAMMRCIVR